MITCTVYQIQIVYHILVQKYMVTRNAQLHRWANELTSMLWYKPQIMNIGTQMTIGTYREMIQRTYMIQHTHRHRFPL